ncbi:MAG: hypothetical protein H0X38_16465 [Planctomycetes bacterium]|nr:hypothetical protein [Planctomycetota bacterium]
MPSLPLVTIVCLLACAASAAEPLPERMTFLDNGTLRIGMDLNRGGAVTFLEAAARPGNLINSYDYGRQIQMSVYSGPTPFTPHGKQPRPEWRGLGWNPIQTGDCFGRPSQVVEQRNDGKELYLRCVPMQWPLDDEPGECTFETWTMLDGASVRMRFRVTNHRTDHTQYAARSQELPAIYTIAALHRLITYSGPLPFTGAVPDEQHNDWHQPWPWTTWLASEGWSALVGDDDWGLGVFRDDGCFFNGGLYGEAGSRDPHAVPTGYLAPVETETLDHDIVYDHACLITVGTLAEIRARSVAAAVALRQAPAWLFSGPSRLHWHVDGATDAGLPLVDGWRILLGEGVPRLVSPQRCWPAAARLLTVVLTWPGPTTTGRIFWTRSDARERDAAKSLPLPLLADPAAHTYRIDLGASPEYRGLIAGLAVDPCGEPHPGSTLVLHSVALGER